MRSVTCYLTHSYRLFSLVFYPLPKPQTQILRDISLRWSLWTNNGAFYKLQDNEMGRLFVSEEHYIDRKRDWNVLMVCNRLITWRWKWENYFCFRITCRGVLLNVLNDHFSQVFWLWTRLGHTGLLQPCSGNVGLGFSSAVENDLSEEEDGWQDKSN